MIEEQEDNLRLQLGISIQASCPDQRIVTNMLPLGDQLPATVESKRLRSAANKPLAKGHERYDKYARHKESDLDKYATDGSRVDLQPAEDGLAAGENMSEKQIDKITGGRERKEIETMRQYIIFNTDPNFNQI